MNGNRRQQQRGLSLVELLVAMTIAMVILGGVTQTLITNQKNQQWSDNVAYIQENARYASDLLSRDVRLAGYFGCAVKGARTFDSVNPGGFADLLNMVGIQGWDGTQTPPASFAGVVTTIPYWASGSGNPKPDIFIIERADDSLDLGVASHNPSAAQFQLTRYNPMSPGDLAIVVGATCSDVSLVQMSGPSSGPTNVTFVHNTGSGTPGNCTKIIKYDTSFVCDGNEPTSADCGGSGKSGSANCAYSPGATIMRFVAHGYYIGYSSSGTASDPIPALIRVSMQNSGGNSIAVPEELVPGVEDMQLLYGLDEDGDGNADRYAQATSIASSDWDKVVSARISLVMRSYQKVVEDPASKPTVILLGHTYPKDGYLRQQVNLTVRLRNVGLGG